VRSGSRIIISVFVIVACFTAVFGLSNFLEDSRVKVPESFADEDLGLQGKRLKGYALGFEGLLADWYWMRSLQYIGDKVVNRGFENINIEDLTPLNPRLLYPLLDNSTDLDPSLMAAYSYGATVLPAINADHAIRLTEKGIAANPDQWRLHQYLGYIYWRLKDYEMASKTYERGAQVPGAPPFFKLMAARMKTESGSRDTAREIYSQMLREAPDQQTRNTAELRLMELDSLDEREVIDRELGVFKKSRGRCVSGWPELLPQLRDATLPRDRDFSVDATRNLVDPSGVPYQLYEPTCKVYLGATSKIPKQ
jgi:tetratricopeptide (TPR) repeat protein